MTVIQALLQAQGLPIGRHQIHPALRQEYEQAAQKTFESRQQKRVEDRTLPKHARPRKAKGPRFTGPLTEFEKRLTRNALIMHEEIEARKRRTA